MTLFVALLVGSFGVRAAEGLGAGFIDNPSRRTGSRSPSRRSASSCSSSPSTTCSRTCDLRVRDVLPGAILATVLLEATFQVLPIFLRYAELNPVLKAFGAPAILLVWLYVMANVIVFGAELNWWRQHGAREAADSTERTRSGCLRLTAASNARRRLRRGAVRVLAPSTRSRARRPFASRRRDEDRVVAEAFAARAARARSCPRACRCRAAPRPPARARRARRRSARAGPRRPRSASSSAATPSSAQRADSTPGRPPSAATSIPESSPSTHVGRALDARTRALPSALS